MKLFTIKFINAEEPEENYERTVKEDHIIMYIQDSYLVDVIKRSANMATLKFELSILIDLGQYIVTYEPEN